MKIVIHAAYGGFRIPAPVCRTLKVTEYDRNVLRNDPVLVEYVEKNADAALPLKIVEIPDDVDWYIEEYDGNEWVAERHRTWR